MRTLENVTHIFERISVKCPYGAARRYIQQDVIHSIPSIPPFTLQLESAEDPLKSDQRLYVTWKPKESAPLPHFFGELVLRPELGINGSVLEISGDYVPPFGAPGRAFDLFIGQKIAMATAKSVLRKIAEDIERSAKT